MPDFNDRTGPNQLTLAAPPDSERFAGARNTVDGATISAKLGSGSSPRVDLYIGKTLDGRYLIEQLLGEGGMGVVYRGRHKVIDKRVAIKILRVDMAADAEMVERFLNEARAASSIGNPHIVDISDFGRLEDGATYFVMEYLDGQSLGAVMSSSGVIPIPRLVHIAKQIARGLAAAHARGIVHRDLKPDNVMLVTRGGDRDFAKVLDFGIAKVSSEAGKLTRAGSVFGTPHYMSPEQAAGVPVDQRTDIYSLGIILYEMASGKVPFDADNFMGILTQHMYKSPAPIRALVPQPQDVPPGLEAIVLKCLSKKVELRYQSMEEVAADLERAEMGIVPEAVQEMMGRSGGFNVPADYFRKQVPGGPTMLPATPSFARKKPVLAMVIATALAFSFLLIAALVAWPILAAPRESAQKDVPDPLPSAGVATAAATGPTAAGIPVIVTVEPADALVGLGDGELQRQPLTLLLGASDHVTVHVERKGYVSQTVALDGATRDPKLGVERVSLVREKAPSVLPVARPTPTTLKPTAKATASAAAPPVKPPDSKTGPCPMGQWRDPFGNCTKL